jgi:hypothetical protein
MEEVIFGNRLRKQNDALATELRLLTSFTPCSGFPKDLFHTLYVENRVRYVHTETRHDSTLMQQALTVLYVINYLQGSIRPKTLV